MFPASIPETVGDAELASVEMIATAMGGLLSHPACPGPLLIHVDGAFECHGTDCPGAMAISTVTTSSSLARAIPRSRPCTPVHDALHIQKVLH
jgi:hypothetical protein